MESSDANPRSLVELLRKNIINAISSTVAPNKWRVVVVDRPSLKIVSFVLKMHEILEHNVMAVQLITRSRQQYPDVEAVYILVPCEDSIARVIEDFKPSLEQAAVERTKYARAHLFFTGALSDSLLLSLRQSSAAPYIKGIDELFIEYNPIESRVFLTIPSEQPFYALYSPHSSNMVHRDLDAAADRVLSVIACLGIRPYIRYYRPTQRSATKAAEYPKIAEAMAEKLQQKLENYYTRRAANSNNKNKREKSNDISPSVVIVLDRSVDMYAPLLHEFTYQATVHDLIDLEDGCKYTYEINTLAGKTQQASATLSEQSDEIWRQYRHEHICHVAEELVAQFETMVNKNIGVKAAHQPGKKMKLGELRAAISELPEFSKLQAMYSMHIDLASKCLDIIGEQELTTISEFEQELVTGVTTNGEQVNRTSIETRLISLLDDQTIEKYDRIRLLFLYLVMVNGGNELDRRRLEQIPQCLTINDRRAAVNLRQLGIPTNDTTSYAESDPNKPTNKCGKYEWKRIPQIGKETLGSRFSPAVYSIIRESLAKELCTELFPWVNEAPPDGPPKHILNVTATSLRRKKGEWGSRNNSQKKAPGDKKSGAVIIYIAGGVTLSEMRAVYEIAQTFKREIYIGSTHIITPRGFLEDLKSLHLKMLI